MRIHDSFTVSFSLHTETPGIDDPQGYTLLLRSMRESKRKIIAVAVAGDYPGAEAAE